jgi:Ca2+-binding EF-hand superfamily protein
MATDTTEQKFAILFRWFDQTDDEWLTQGDFEQLGEVFATLATEDDHQNRDALRNAFQLWWEALLDAGAADDRQRVDQPRFIAAMRSHISEPETLERVVLPIIDALMSALDTDDNGTLTLEEYVRMYDALGIDPATSGAAFQRLDRNGSGTITYDEFRIAVEEFYVSTDAEAPGNWLLGSPLPSG